MTIQKNYEEILLEVIYSKFDTLSEFSISLIELQNEPKLLNESIIEINFWLKKMEDDGFFKILEGSSTFGARIAFKLEGFLHYEDKPHTPEVFTQLTVKMLEFLRKIELDQEKLSPGSGNQIGTYPLSNFFKLMNIPESELWKIIFILNGISPKYIRHGGCGTVQKKFIFFGENKPFLTKEGRNYLNYHLRLRTLFANIKYDYARQILTEEYKDIKILMKLEKWKDVAIKMGSILDYLTYNYFQEKNIQIIKKPNPDFHNRVLHIQQKSLIGDPNDWFEVDTLLRPYRNFVHLQELIKRNFVFSQQKIEHILPLFERLIILF